MPQPKNNAILLQKPLREDDVSEIAELLGAYSMERGRGDGVRIQRHPDEPGENHNYLPIVLKHNYFSLLSNKGQKFIAIERGNVSDDELIVALLRLSPKYAEFRDEIIKAFGLPEPEQRHFDSLAQQKAAKEATLRVLETARKTLPKVASNPDIPLHPENTITVSQSDMRVLRENDPQDTLVTEGVTACIAVLYINPQNGRIGIAHLASATDMYLLASMQKEVQSHPGEPVNVVLWGGRPDRSERLGGLIVDWVQHQPGFTLQSADLCDPDRKAKRMGAIALTRKGEMRVENSDLVRQMITPPSELAKEATTEAEGIERLLQGALGIRPRSIKPDSPHLQHGDIGRGRGKNNDTTGKPSPPAE